MIMIGETRVALSLRCYLFQEDGAIKRIPRRVVDGLVHGQDAMPEYVNSVQRIATAVVDNENGKALRIVDARGEYWTFDEEGKIHKGLSESFAQVMSMVGDERTGKHGKVISLTPALKRRKFQQEHRWNLTKEHLDWIAADIWPSENDRSPAHVSIATGKELRRPPLTYEAKEALRKIDEKLASVGFELDRLSELALKGLAFEARQRAEAQSGLWAGLADECDHLREIKARRRTGRGIWYAVIEAERPDSDDADVTHVDDLAFEKCQGKKGRG
jgi:hypothetical protein